jgi:hypothetical protein
MVGADGGATASISAPDSSAFARKLGAGYASNNPVERGSMQRRRSGVVVATLFVAMAAALFAQGKEKDSGMPKVGDVAPDFRLKYFDGNDLKDVKLSDYRGKKNVVLAFYVFAFTGG